MKANNYISIKEHKLLLTAAFMIFALAFSNLTLQSIDKYNNYVSEKQEKLERQANKEPTFEFYSFGRKSGIPFLNLISIFIFITLSKSKNYIISFLLVAFTFSFFIYELLHGFRIFLYDNSFPELNLIQRLSLIGNPFDYAVFLLVSILLFWQISILLRILIKTTQRKPELP